MTVTKLYLARHSLSWDGASSNGHVQDIVFGVRHCVGYGR